jgi:hypothetical protein
MIDQPSIPAPASRDRFRARSLDPAWRWSLGVYGVCRAFLLVWMAWISASYPRFVEEASVSVWPGSAVWDTWLRRVVLWPNVRYDVLWYLGIAEHGYAYRDGATAYHPLYPLLTGVLGRLIGGHYLLAAWLVAQVCCVLMLVVLYRLVRLDHPEAVARRTTLLLLCSPLGFSFLLPYTESLLLLCFVAAFYAARRGRWWLAGLAGAGAALTKQPGVVVLLPLLWELWQQQGNAIRRKQWGAVMQSLIGLGLIPLGLLAFLVYRATLGDVAFDWRNPITLISALLVTPSYKDVWGEYFSWPWVNFWYAVEQLRSKPYFYLLINFYIMLIMVVIVAYSMRRQRRSYAIFSGLLLLLNLSIVYPLWPYMGIIRRFTVIFPLFIQLAHWSRSRIVFALIMTCQLVLWLYISAAYVRNAFVP